MNCDEAITLVDGYLDGELDAVTSQQVELHLRGCEACQEQYQAQRTLGRTIATTVAYHKAPAELRDAIRSSLRAIAFTNGSQTATSATAVTRQLDQPGRRINVSSQWGWLAAAAAVLVAAVIGLNARPGAGADQFLATQLIGSHVRSLMANHLTDVGSSDQHTVKPWLDQKLDFAPAVVDLTPDGFPLIGGRLDYLNNRPVAALVYQRRKHFINLFIWPKDSGSSAADKMISRQGYQLLHWADSDFNYWAVSDVSENDLRTMKQLFEKQLPRR